MLNNEYHSILSLVPERLLLWVYPAGQSFKDLKQVELPSRRIIATTH